ncbi:MAG: Uma2 family endonuclease [Candidatus Eremiobacteraeota bacterium]|nr:Uma2 family endonuclease [Candidatus Eremiobacteraeota bacterium]
MDKAGSRKPFTYGDYLSCPDEGRFEVLEGTLYAMTPAPSRMHQKILLALASKFYNYFEGKLCEVYCAPFDVRLAGEGEKDGDITTVVQPDIAVVCDRAKLDEKGCLGSPDLIIEISSPQTASYDYIKKLSLYEKHGVKEYWIVSQADMTLMIFKLQENKEYGKPEIYSRDDTVRPGLFSDLAIDMREVFRQ